MNIKSLNQNIYIGLSFIIILATNNYFTYEQSLVFGARDGFDYFTIADKLGNIPQETLSYHKAWRFIVPGLIGIISKFSDLNTYIVFRIFTIITSFSAIYFFNLILTKLKIDKYHIFFLSLFFIFNPYLFRFFVANPTMLNDLVFINSGLLIVLSYINNNKKTFYLGLLLGLVTRQNAIFYLISIIIVKIIFKNKSFFKLKDIIFSIFLTLFIFGINNNFANLYTEYNDSYSFTNRFNLFTFNYTIKEFINYNLFLLIIFIPIVVYIFLEKKKFKFNLIKKEFFILVLLITFFISSIAYVGGPMITGRNLIRLCNLVYPLIILILIYPFEFKIKKYHRYKYFYLPLIFIWSLHPTFSNIELFNFLKF